MGGPSRLTSRVPSPTAVVLFTVWYRNDGCWADSQHVVHRALCTSLGKSIAQHGGDLAGCVMVIARPGTGQFFFASDLIRTDLVVRPGYKFNRVKQGLVRHPSSASCSQPPLKRSPPWPTNGSPLSIPLTLHPPLFLFRLLTTPGSQLFFYHKIAVILSRFCRPYPRWRLPHLLSRVASQSSESI